MIFIFPLFALLAFAIWVASAIRARSVSGVPREQTAALAGVGLAYGLGVLAVSLDPYYVDNGSRAFIDWPERWVWALEWSGWIGLGLVPLAVIFVRWRKR